MKGEYKDEFSKVAERVARSMEDFDRGHTIIAHFSPIRELIAFPPQFPTDLLQRMQSIEAEEYRRSILQAPPRNTEMDILELENSIMKAEAIREAKAAQKQPKNKYQFIDGIYGRNNRREQCR